VGAGAGADDPGTVRAVGTPRAATGIGGAVLVLLIAAGLSSGEPARVTEGRVLVVGDSLPPG